MKVAFGTVVYEDGCPYAEEFIQSLNRQDVDEFDILIMNDGLADEKMALITDRLDNKPFVIAVEPGTTPVQARIELIKKAKALHYDLLIFGDFDDTFSEDRISSFINGFDNQYGFFYNDLYELKQHKKFFNNLPLETFDINQLLESNYLGLSNSALNLKSIGDDVIEELYGCKHCIFDWFMYSLFIIRGIKGKRIQSGKTLYRIHDSNTAGRSCDSYDYVMKEIQVKLNHYHSLEHIDPIFKIKLHLYNKLKQDIQHSKIEIMDVLDRACDHWWGKLNLNKIGME